MSSEKQLPSKAPPKAAQMSRSIASENALARTIENPPDSYY
jgi:hypothetical protein